MAYFLGKGGGAPIDGVAGAPSVTGQPSERQKCTEKCQNRYQIMLADNNIDDASAQQFYNRCIEQCQGLPEATPFAALAGAERAPFAYTAAEEAAEVTKAPMAGVAAAKPTAMVQAIGPGDGDDYAECKYKCTRQYQADLAGGLDPDEANRKYQACVNLCDDVVTEPCTRNEDCPTGYDCVNGRCVPAEGMVLACNGGRCAEVRGATGAAIEACKGKKVGDECYGEQPCDPVTNPCPSGFKCVMGKCVPDGDEDGDGDGCEGGYKLTDASGFAGGTGRGRKPKVEGPITADHGWYRSADWMAHQLWNEQHGFQNVHDVVAFIEQGTPFASSRTNVCKKWHTLEVIDGVDWCCPEGARDGAGTLGEFAWPPEMQELYKLLMGRGKEFLGMEPGYSQAVIDAMFGKGFEDVRGLQRPTREQTLVDLGRAGQLGTGEEVGVMTDLSWKSEQNVSDLIRDIFLMNEQQKRADLYGYSGAARDIFGTGMGYNVALEQMNAARRGEGMQSLAMFLQYIMTLMQSWGQ